MFGQLVLIILVFPVGFWTICFDLYDGFATFATFATEASVLTAFAYGAAIISCIASIFLALTAVSESGKPGKAIPLIMYSGSFAFLAFESINYLVNGTMVPLWLHITGPITSMVALPIALCVAVPVIVALGAALSYVITALASGVSYLFKPSKREKANPLLPADAKPLGSGNLKRGMGTPGEERQHDTSKTPNEPNEGRRIV